MQKILCTHTCRYYRQMVSLLLHVSPVCRLFFSHCISNSVYQSLSINRSIKTYFLERHVSRMNQRARNDGLIITFTLANVKQLGF